MDIEWIDVPQGSFIMGTNEEEARHFMSDSALQHVYWSFPQKAVYVEAFRISKYPITNAQYRVFLEETTYTSSSPYMTQYILENDETYAQHPACWISWYDAQKFCRWVGARLPTEVEWEKAARGHMGNIYAWGDTWNSSYCNSRETHLGITTPVHYYEENISPYGMCDVSGNVYEWTSSTAFIPANSGHTTVYYDLPILRGGSIASGQHEVRLDARFIKFAPQERGDWVGFRIVQL